MRRSMRKSLLFILVAVLGLAVLSGPSFGQNDNFENQEQGSASGSARLRSPSLVADAIGDAFAPAPEIETGPWEYPRGINPLTGLPYPNDEALKRRNLIVKISNWPPKVRPQRGINQADLVYEYEAEGGVTRFAAIFRNNAPEQVGSIRSARLLDIELISMYAALLAYSGTSAPIHDIYTNAPFRPLLISPSFGDNCDNGGFCRDDSIVDLGYEHTLFGDTNKMWELATRRNQNYGYRANGFAFDLQANDGGKPARDIYINWYNRTDVRWQYDETSQRYRRYADGVPHVDAEDDTQLWADNLVILQVTHNRRPDLFTPGSIDESYEVALWGQGAAYVMREGRLYHGLWWRRSQSRGEALRLIFPDGDPILLKPGRSWVTIVRSLDSAQISAELAEIQETTAFAQS